MITAAELRAMLPATALDWLAGNHSPLEEVFPAVARAVGRAELAADWTTDQAARALLLVGQRIGVISRLYRFGDAAEKLAVLRGLSVAEVEAEVGDTAVPIVADAIRTNDSRLLTAALGPYATRHLSPSSFRQAVLKCIFTGVPLAAVHGLPARLDDELRRMMTDFAAERTAAGRPVPPDLNHYLGPGGR